MVIIDASQALDPGSIPGRRNSGFGGESFYHFHQSFFFFFIPNSDFTPDTAHVAQLGERQTEDLKVLGSIPSVGSTALVAQFGRAWV